MADISHHQFIALLKKSNVIEPKKLQPWLDKTTKIESGRKLAKSLVQEGLLTTWQAKFLLSGRYRLRIGNYFLLSRLQRDELGARYLAIHASLARKVELQIFSRDLTSDTQRWKDLIQKATLVAKLDHPSLVHVYDIDHDDERYFLVVEHVTGRSLDVEKEIFTTPQIGKLIFQCAQGVEFAHQNKVVHGTIDQADVLLTDKGAVKLQNLTVSPMRNLNSDAPEAEPVTDYGAIAELGKKLLQANPGADGGPGVGLAAVFASMESDWSGSIEKLKQWIEANPDAGQVELQTTDSGANPIFSSPTVGKRSQNAVTSSSIDPDEHDESEVLSPSASIIESAKASPPFLIACAIGLVMFGGIVAFGLSRVYGKIVDDPAAAVAAAERVEEDLAAQRRLAKHKADEQRAFDNFEAKNKQNKQPEKKSRKEPAKKARNANSDNAKADKPKRNNAKPNKPKPNSDKPDKVKSDNAKPDSAKPDKAKPDEKQPSEAGANGDTAEAKPSKFMDILNIRSDPKKAAGSDEKAAGGNSGIPAATKESPDDLKKIKGIGGVTEKALYAAGVKTYGQIAKLKPNALMAILKKEKVNFSEEKCADLIAEAKSLAAEIAAVAAKHFAKVPELLDLPPVDTSEAVKLMKLLIPSNYLLTTELVCPKGVSPKRIFFELNKSGSDNQAWIVSAKRTEASSKSSEIATFKKTDDAFMFEWLPGAAKEKSSIYLKNCLLRLSTPDGQSCISKLRKPIEVRALRITEDNLNDALSVAIEAMPDFDQVRIQLRALESKRKLKVLDSQITPDAPAVVVLRARESNDEFMTLQISAARSGRSIKMAAGLFFNDRPIKAGNQLAGMKNQFEQNYAVTQQRLSTKPQNGELVKQNNAAKRIVGRMDEYLEGIKWLVEGSGGLGSPLEFEISAEFEDGRVLLAKSNKNIVNKDKKKKKKK